MAHPVKNLKALILVGGYGTRLKPLTLTKPKPLIPFVNKPILKHQIEALAEAGVNEIILALNYYSNLIIKEVAAYSKEFNINIIYSKEKEELGTGGPLALASQYLTDDFFVLNSDVICTYPLKEMMKYHIDNKKEVTLLSTSVSDPSRYGLILTEENTNIVTKFVEKPKEILSNKINAGIYIFNESILKRIELKNCSLEREIFPKVVKERQLQVFDLKGFWMDIGQVPDFLEGQRMFLLEYRNIMKDVFDVRNNVVLGKDVKIGKNVKLKNVAIFDGVTIGNDVTIENSIIGWKSIIEDNVKISDFSVLRNSEKIKKNSILRSYKG